MNSIRDARLRLLAYGFLVYIIIIIIRLFYLQIEQKHVLEGLGQKNFLRTKTIAPLRGNLFDCNGVLLAANKPIFDLYWQGQGGRIHETQRTLLRQIGTILNIDFLSQEKYLPLKSAQRYARRCLLRRNVPFNHICQISETCGNAHCLIVENRFERVYPYKSLASHVLGYLSRVEGTGKNGLERLFQQELSGHPGYSRGIFNAMGKQMHQQEYQEAQAGKDLTLTLDVALQFLAESLFEKNQAGSLIVMDPENGAIKVLVSSPNVDPNLFLTRISFEEWNEKCSVNNPLLDRATKALYPPASIFKLITVTAGLEEGVITQDSIFNCKGYMKFCGRNYLCQRRWGHGKLKTQDAIAHSCNILCFEIAKKLDIDVLASYAYRFGLGSKTRFLLPEKAGLVPTSMWKKIYKGERWWTGESLSASIGQSYLLVTPLQIARMISAICSGYLVRPRILVSQEVEKDPLAISEDTHEFLKRAMHLAVSKGTVRRLRGLDDFYIFAKTGTAQTCDLHVKKTKREHYEHAWLTSFFQYKNEQPLTLVVLLEHAGASLPAVLMAKKFLQGYAELKQKGMVLVQHET